LFGAEFKEIHAPTDPSEMSASKKEVSASLQASIVQSIPSKSNLSSVLPPRPPPSGPI
jgi:hypothetical protein